MSGPTGHLQAITDRFTVSQPAKNVPISTVGLGRCVTGNPPKSSVIIPTKDRTTLLRRAVSSVLCSDRPDIEVLVVDDHSDPPAIAALEQFQDDFRLRVLDLNGENEGVSAARNLGLRMAEGELLLFLDDDDTIAPGYLERIENIDHDTFGYGCSAYERVSGTGASTVDRRFEEGPIPRNVPIRKQLFGLGMGFWMTRACYEAIGELDEDLSINEDTDYFCRLLQHGISGWYSSEVGVTVCLHNTGTDLQNISNRCSASERARCMRILADRYPSMRAHLGGKYIDHTLKAGMIKEAWSYVRTDNCNFMRLKFGARLVVKYVAYCLKPSKKVTQNHSHAASHSFTSRP